MAYAGADREVIQVFKESGKTVAEKPAYVAAGFTLVSYDGSPDRFAEPVNVCPTVDTLGQPTTPAEVTALPRVAGFEFYRGRYGTAMSFPPDKIDVT